MIRWCECGRVMPCKYKGHQEFDSATYAKKHIRKPTHKWGGGYSAFQDEMKCFQPGVDKRTYKNANRNIR